MAIEQLQSAPVITPRTLKELARILREHDRQELADVVSDLIPVVQEVVENHFKPLSWARSENDFRDIFETKSREFEPYRLYINMTLLQSLHGQNFFKFYSDLLMNLNEKLLLSADAKQIPAKRVKNVFEQYFATFAVLLQFMMGVDNVQIPNRVEALNLAAWIRSATNLDYGLTSLFLILEEAISAPPRLILESLVTTSEESLHNFADQCKILVRAISAGRPASTSTPGAPERTQELAWLKDMQQAGFLRELGGKWIVIEGRRLIANDSSYDAARVKASDAGIARPFIIFIPESPEPAFMGL